MPVQTADQDLQPPQTSPRPRREKTQACVIEHIEHTSSEQPVTVVGYPGEPMLVISALGTSAETALGVLPADCPDDSKDRGAAALQVVRTHDLPVE